MEWLLYRSQFHSTPSLGDGQLPLSSRPYIFPSLLWGSTSFVECLAVLGSALPHNTHVPPPDNEQRPAAEADSPSGGWPSQGGYPGPLWSLRQSEGDKMVRAFLHSSILQRDEMKEADVHTVSLCQRERTRKGKLEGKVS